MKQLTGVTWQLEGSESTQDSYRPILNGKFVLFSSTGMPDGAAAIGISGVHPETGKWTWWTFRSDGSVDVSEFTANRQSDGKLFVNVAGIDASKLKMAYSFDFGPTLSKMEGEGFINGREMPIEMAWKRIPLTDQSWLDSQPPADVPKAMQFTKYLTGPKSMQTRFGNEVGVGASMGKWILDGKFFLYTASRYTGEAHDEQLGIAGFNPNSGKYQSWEFSGDGAAVSAELGDDGMSISGTLLRPQPPADREELQFNGRFQVVDGELVYDAEIGPEDGEKTPYTWKWYSPQGLTAGGSKAIEAAEVANRKMPSEIRKALDEAYIGDWNTKIYRGDKLSRGTTSDRWLPGKNAIATEISETDENGTVLVSELLGWDAEAGELVIVGFGKGVSYECRYSNFDVLEDGTYRFTGSWRGFFDDQPGGSRCTIELSKDGFVYRDTTSGLPFKVVGTRVAKADPREKAKELAFLIGDWEYTDNGSKKKVSAKWINNDSFVQEVDGNVMRIWGWDVQQQEYAMWTYGGLGGYGRASVTKGKDGWHVIGTPYYIANGDAVTSEVVVRVMDENTHRITGQFQDTKFDTTFRRIE